MEELTDFQEIEESEEEFLEPLEEVADLIDSGEEKEILRKSFIVPFGYHVRNWKHANNRLHS